MSRRYTLIAASRMPSDAGDEQQRERARTAAAGGTPTRRASARSRAPTNSTMLCRKKCTSALPTARERQDLARERHLLHQARVADDRAGRAAEAGREQVPHEQAREQEDRERRDARLQDQLEHDVEDDEVQERVQQRPHEAEDAVLVLDLQLLAHHPDEELAVLDDPHEALPGVIRARTTALRTSSARHR